MFFFYTFFRVIISHKYRKTLQIKSNKYVYYIIILLQNKKPWRAVQIIYFPKIQQTQILIRFSHKLKF